MISKSGLVPAGGGGIAALAFAAAASASACINAAIVMPLGKVSLSFFRASSSADEASSAAAGGRGADGATGLPKAPVGNLGAGGIVGDRRIAGRGAVGTMSDGGVCSGASVDGLAR